MNKKQFYRQCYLSTGGWMPMLPLGQTVELGDFCQLQPERVKVLGNVFGLGLIEEVQLSEPLLLNINDWNISDGVEQVFCATEQRQSGEWTKQVLEFAWPGAFIFYANSPNSRLILNWSHFKAEITIKLTQADYCFRDIYVVTAVANVAASGLVVAAKGGAKLETSTQLRATDYFALIGEQSSLTEQSNHIECFEKHHQSPAYFFKAKKLVLTDHKKERFIAEILKNHEQTTVDTIADWMNSDLLNLVKVNELNLATCLEYFDWVDVSLDDVEKLC